MPEEGLVIVWQLGASSVFPWQVYKVFADARGSLFMIVRQLVASSIPLAGL